MYYGCMDWNGDGVMNGFDLGIEIGVVQSIADDLAREDRISRMTKAIREYDEADSVDNSVFWELCRKIGVPMSDFEQCDIDEINRRLEE